MEAVIGTVVFKADPGKTAQTSAIRKLWATLGILWVAFSAAPTIQESIEAWPKIVHEISSGEVVSEAEKPSLPAQPSPPAQPSDAREP